MGYFRNIYGDQNVYISGEKLRGVQSVNASFEIPYDPIKAAGIGYLNYTINSNLEGSFNVNRYVVSNEDPLSGLLGSEISGHIHYGTGAKPLLLSFNKGYVNSYSSSCAVGNVPNLDFGVVAYGDMGSGVSTGIEKPNSETIAIARPGDITLSGVSGHTTNRVQSYSYNISIPRKPIYTLGSGLEPDLFNIDYPIEIDLSFDMHVDDFEVENMHDLLCDQPKNDISIILSGCNIDYFLRKFIAPKPLFLGIDQNSSINDELSVTLKYKSYINDVRSLPPLIGGGQITIDVEVIGDGTVEFVEFF